MLYSNLFELRLECYLHSKVKQITGFCKILKFTIYNIYFRNLLLLIYATFIRKDTSIKSFTKYLNSILLHNSSFTEIAFCFIIHVLLK